MRILVTGGARFIGGYVAETFAASHDVTVPDNFESYYDLGIKEHNSEAAKKPRRPVKAPTNSFRVPSRTMKSSTSSYVMPTTFTNKLPKLE